MFCRKSFWFKCFTSLHLLLGSISIIRFLSDLNSFIRLFYSTISILPLHRGFDILCIVSKLKEFQIVRIAGVSESRKNPFIFSGSIKMDLSIALCDSNWIAGNLKIYKIFDEWTHLAYRSFFKNSWHDLKFAKNACTAAVRILELE